MKFLVLMLIFFEVLSAQVVCIHGFKGAPSDLHRIQTRLIENEFDVINYAYPSKDKKLLEHGHDLALFLQKVSSNRPGKPISFVAHSMGGLILRASLNDPACPEEAKKGYAVLIATPSQGCFFSRWYGSSRIGKWTLGPESGEEIASEQNRFEHLGQFPPKMKLLVIAGKIAWQNVSLAKPLKFRYNPIIRDDNDGLVRVVETHLSTPHKHIVIEGGGHDYILSMRETIDYVQLFLSPMQVVDAR